jgi:hypothetical protein
MNKFVAYENGVNTTVKLGTILQRALRSFGLMI